MNIQDFLYLCLLVFFLISGTLGIFHTIFSVDREKNLQRSRFFKNSQKLFFLSFKIAWIFELILFIATRHTHWLYLVFTPLLLIISAISFWQLKEKIISASKKHIDIIFIIFMTSFIFLLGLQWI